MHMMCVCVRRVFVHAHALHTKNNLPFFVIIVLMQTQPQCNMRRTWASKLQSHREKTNGHMSAFFMFAARACFTKCARKSSM